MIKPGNNCLVFDALDGVLRLQPLTEMGIPDGALRTLALTYLAEGQIEIGAVDHVKVIASPNAPTGLALPQAQAVGGSSSGINCRLFLR